MVEIKGIKYYSSEDLSNMFKVDKKTVSYWRRNGKIKSYQLNDRKFLFSENDIEEFIKNKRND